MKQPLVQTKENRETCPSVIFFTFFSFICIIILTLSFTHFSSFILETPLGTNPETAGSSSSANAELSSTQGVPLPIPSGRPRLNPELSFPFWEIIRMDPWNAERCGDGVSCFSAQPHPCGFAKAAFDDIVKENPVLGQ